ncbi:MAG: histidine kinase dimerization/phosphoacceptor domain -containing protein [Spirochaetia bacterium]|nr:histidine kinase dimerization/phosphoacceptor domain -containing protein [Spirochaetia bacterium]
MKRFIVSILIVIIFLNSLALASFFIVHSHNSFAVMRNRNIDDIQRQVMDRLESFNVFVQPFEQQIREYNETAIMEIYQELIERTKDDPLSVEQGVLEKLVAQYNGLDVYLIDSKGVVQKSTLESDIGLNLLRLNEGFSNYIRSIYGSGSVSTQRLSISTMQGTKMIYTYFSPEGSNWLLETSVSFEEYMRGRYQDGLYTQLFHTFFTEIQTSNSELTEFDVIYQTDISSRSLLSGQEIPLDQKVLKVLERESFFRNQEGRSLVIYRKLQMTRSGFDFVQYPIIYLEYDLSYYYEFLSKFYFIAGASMLLLIVLFSGVAYKLVEKKLVQRVEELDEVLQRAANEDYSVRARYTSRIPELMTLSSSANRLIQQVHSREQELRTALEEREMLLDEIHHRVKNNLNVVISLLNLQHEQVTSVEEVKQALLKTRNRIYSMALTHEKLYQSENFSDVNMKMYVESFLSTFTTSVGEQLPFQIESFVEEVNLSITHAVPCGIILNELLMNAVEHAFPAVQDGLIKVSFTKRSDNRFSMIVEDNGVGMPADFSLQEADSLGLVLVDALIKQLRGELKISKSTGVPSGTRFEILFEAAETGYS